MTDTPVRDPARIRRTAGARRALEARGLAPGEITAALLDGVPGASAGWLVGSLALGRGNSTSDIDAIVLATIDDQDTARLAPVTYVREHRIDVRGVRPGWIERYTAALARVVDDRASDGDRRWAAAENELTLLARVAYGWELPGFAPGAPVPPVDPTHVTVALVLRDVERVRRHLVIGSLARRAGRGLVLLEAATTVTEVLLHAVATAREGYVSSPKWLWEVAADVAPDLVARARTVLAAGRSPVERWTDAQEFVTAVLGEPVPDTFTVTAPGVEVLRFHDRWLALDTGTGRSSWLPAGGDPAPVRALVAGVDLTPRRLPRPAAAAVLDALAVAPASVTGPPDGLGHARALVEGAP